MTHYQVDPVLSAYAIVLAYGSRDFLRLDDHKKPNDDYFMEMAKFIHANCSQNVNIKAVLIKMSAKRRKKIEFAVKFKTG